MFVYVAVCSEGMLSFYQRGIHATSFSVVHVNAGVPRRDLSVFSGPPSKRGLRYPVLSCSACGVLVYERVYARHFILQTRPLLLGNTAGLEQSAARKEKLNTAHFIS